MIATETKYKKTGIYWMPEIPEHWEMRRLGSIGKFSKGGNISRSELVNEDEVNTVAAVLYGDLYTKYDIVASDIFNKISKVTAAKSVLLKKGDLLFTGSGETKEDIGKCVLFNSNAPAYAGGDVIIFKQDIFDGRFISYSQNSSLAKYQKYLSSKGEIIVHTYASKLRDVVLPYPPLDEQKVIADYLDTQSAKITRFIQTKQRFIELLKEQRQSIIDESLDIEAKKIRLKFCVLKVGSGVTPKGGASVYQSSGVIFLRSQNIHDDSLRLDDVAFITGKIHSEMSSSQVRRGDILLNITGASIGRCYWYDSDEEANVNQHVSIIRPNFEILNSEFLMYQIQSQRIQHLINTVQGASREGLTIHEIKNYPLLVPSTIEEQKQIVDHIKTETRTLDIAISKAEREIELIKEYREAMIAEAVTGKMKL